MHADVIAVPLEERVVLDVHGDHEVSRAGRTGLALAAHAHFLALLDAGGDAHVNLLTGWFTQADSGSPNCTGEGDGGARRAVGALARRGLETSGETAAAAAAEQIGEFRRQVAVAVGAACAATGPGPGTLPEEVAEDVLEPAGLSSAACPSSGEPRSPTHGADCVVLLTLLSIGEDRVGLGDILEHALRAGVPTVLVRVVLARKLPVRLFDIGIGCVFGDTEDLVEILIDPILTSQLVSPFPFAFKILLGCGTNGTEATTTRVGPSCVGPSIFRSELCERRNFVGPARLPHAG